MKKPQTWVTFALLLAVLGVQGCSDLGSEPTLSDDEDDVREESYRYFFEHNYSGAVGNQAGLFFLEVNDHPHGSEPDHDPSDMFMARFAGHRPRVKKLSECTRSAYGVLDNLTGESGIIISTGLVRRLDANRIEVWGGYYESGVSASLNRLVLHRVFGNHWVVVTDELKGIA